MKQLVFIFLTTITFNAWAQPKCYPVSWNMENTNTTARTTATTYSDTLTLPFVYDFNNVYLQIDTIYNNLPVAPTNILAIKTLRAHGLLNGDSIWIESVVSPTALNGKKFAKRISRLVFEVYNDQALSSPFLMTNEYIQYARISKKGAIVSTVPDSLAFYANNGGALVLPGYSKNQVSYYTACFDGLNYLGVPYNNSIPITNGKTDELTSQAFDLSTYTLADSLYFSFMYEQGGNGDAPDLNDYFYLEFLDKNGVWNMVWSKEGGTNNNNDTFYTAMVGIKDVNYLYKGFKYRFYAYGRQSGSYDVWNLNYIYFNKGRTILNAKDYRDYSVATCENSILKNYTAMPYKHFFTNPSTYLKSTLSFTSVNHNQNIKSRVYRIDLEDNYGNSIFVDNNNIASASSLYREKYSIPVSPTITNLGKPIYVKQNYSISDVQLSDKFSPFDFMFNNRVATTTYLWDYYAYDDGQAEFAYGTDASGSKIAVKYKTEIYDTLKCIDFYFAQSKGGSTNGLKIFLNVWDENFNVLSTEVISIIYPSLMNEKTRYTLSKPVILNAGQTYHIGYQQNFNSLMTLGFDVNNNHSDKLFYNINGTWQAYTADAGYTPGSLMIHPVFFKNEYITSTEKPLSLLHEQFNLYPNPAQNEIHIQGMQDHELETQFRVYNLQGSMLLEGSLTNENNSIITTSLSSGLYLIQLQNPTTTQTLRFIKE